MATESMNMKSGIKLTIYSTVVGKFTHNIERLVCYIGSGAAEVCARRKIEEEIGGGGFCGFSSSFLFFFDSKAKEESASSLGAFPVVIITSGELSSLFPPRTFDTFFPHISNERCPDRDITIRKLLSLFPSVTQVAATVGNLR